MKKNSIVSIIVLIFTASVFTACGGNNETTHTQNNEHGTSILSANEAELKPAISHYYHLKDALVKADAAEASNGANTMNEALDAILISDEDHRSHLEGTISDLKDNLQNISGTNNLEKQREYFEPVSDKFYELLKTAGTSGETVYRQYCPMAFNDKGAYWLSSEKEIRNPYFGDAMLKCGSVKETLN
jgi:Cu(I)/Ag(I) efflux system membrane fusion protein